MQEVVLWLQVHLWEVGVVWGHVLHHDERSVHFPLVFGTLGGLLCSCKIARHATTIVRGQAGAAALLRLLFTTAGRVVQVQQLPSPEQNGWFRIQQAAFVDAHPVLLQPVDAVEDVADGGHCKMVGDLLVLFLWAGGVGQAGREGERCGHRWEVGFRLVNHGSFGQQPHNAADRQGEEPHQHVHEIFPSLHADNLPAHFRKEQGDGNGFNPGAWRHATITTELWCFCIGWWLCVSHFCCE
jgi:hypothetical protein